MAIHRMSGYHLALACSLLLAVCVSGQDPPGYENPVAVAEGVKGINGTHTTVVRAFGSRVVLRCDGVVPDYAIIDKVLWYDVGNYHPVSGEKGVQLGQNMLYLVIPSLQEQHSGRWACRILHCNRSVIVGQPRCSRSIASADMFAYLKSKYPPQAKIEVATHRVIAGQRLEVNCDRSGSAELNVSFRINRTHTYSTSSLHTAFLKEQAVPSDQGVFECVVHSPSLNLTATADTNIIVYEPPRAKVTPELIRVYSGTTVNITCEGVSVDPDVYPVTYSFEGEDSYPLCLVNQKQRLHWQPVFNSQPAKSATRVFSAIQVSDGGTHYCYATTPRLQGCLESVSRRGATVQVVDRPPMAQLSREGQSLAQGRRLVRVAGVEYPRRDQVILACSTVGYVRQDLTVKTTWYHNGSMIVPGAENSGLFRLDVDRLYFHSFQPQLNGYFSCSANYEGFPEVNATHTNPIELFVQVPPEGRVTASGTNYTIGERFNASCGLVKGNGRRMFTQWRRKVGDSTYAMPLINKVAGVSILNLENLNLRDAGEYVCVATDPDLEEPSLMSHKSSIVLTMRRTEAVQAVPPSLADQPETSPTPASVEPRPTGKNDKAADISDGSPIADDRTYITIAIVGGALALLVFIFIIIFLVFMKRRRHVHTVSGKDPEKRASENGHNGSLPNNVPKHTQLVLTGMTDNPNYETVLVVTRSGSDESGERKKDSTTLSSRDDGIADCSNSQETDQEAPGTPSYVVLETSNGAAGGKTSAQLCKMTSLASSRTGSAFPQDTEASDVDSEFYAEPIDRTVHARTSIRSFASAMREEGSRTPRGVILRKVKKAGGSQEADTYSLPRDASIQVIDPDYDANYSTPADTTTARPASAVAVDEYHFPADARYSNEQMFIRGSTRGAKGGKAGLRHASSLASTRPSLTGSLRSGVDQQLDLQLSRSPSPVDDALYSQPYAEPPSSMDAIYTTLRKSQRYRDICPDNVKLENEALGSGRFGNVYRGTWTEGSTSRSVAIKTLKDGVDPHDRLLFLQEAAIMGQFRHRNLVRLYGVVTQGNALMLVEELMCSDNLRQYLLKRRPDGNGPSTDQQHIILKMCKGIADGMNYLAVRGFVHRDLAARNIMLDADDTCKIGDFGMSRGMESDHYESSGGVIPVKWSAPEAIEYRSFSSASDVWSYGVVLYEIWTFGKCPYSWWENEVVMVKIKDGYRLPRPDCCPPLVYSLMKDCWEEDKKGRPSFQQILQRLDGPPEALLRMPKALAVNRKAKRTAAEEGSSPDGGGNSDTSSSAKADQS